MAARAGKLGAALVSAAALAGAQIGASGMEPAAAPVRLPPVESRAADPVGNASPKLDAVLVTPERLARGYTIVVVGVNGDNSLSAGLAPGLVQGGYAGAVEVVDWTTGHWPLFIYHLRASGRHQAGAQAIAEKISAYQTHYPGREVNVVGYSAGAVVAVKAVESLAAGQAVDRVVLLAGAISPLYDLRPALRKTRVGMWSYYQPQDLVALWAGTLVAGTADGTHIVSAGAVGFWMPRGATEGDRQLYREKLTQLPYELRMMQSGNLGGHFQCVGRKFVGQWIAPVLDSSPGAETARKAGALRR